jgi:DNA-binding MarR family transcriptional regulator
MLLQVADTLSERALDDIERHGGPRLNRSEALVFAAITPDGLTTVELARVAGMTKQSMHAIVRRLLALGLLRHGASTTDGRCKPLVLSPAGRRVAATARRAFRRYEAELEREIGDEHVAALRNGLARASAALAATDST